MATSRIADSVGRVLGDRYRLVRPLGTGSSAHVYVGEDVRLRRRVAIKVLHPALAEDGAFVRRFRAEAHVVASLRHPHILQVYDWGTDGGSPYLVMELLEGGSLRSLLDAGQLLSPAQAIGVGAGVAQALAYAHRRSLVHRDIKPANLIFDDEGRVAVADFGLARALAEASWTEPFGAVVGTARYAAPEAARGASVDEKADVYALALVLVEAVTGTVPFAADTTIGTLMARVDHPLVVPEALGPLGRVLEAAGTVDPATRIDAATLARGMDRVRGAYPPPSPLVLAAPLLSDVVERDRISPTELPRSRAVLFDAEAETVAAPLRMPDKPPSPPGIEAHDEVQPGDGAEPGGQQPVDTRARRRFHRKRWVAAAVVALVIIAGVVVAVERRPRPYRTVPSVHSQQLAAAKTLLQPLHLKVHVTGQVYSPTVAAGAVVSQTPGQGGRLREGQSLDVTVSKGPQPVPVPTDLTGKDQATATSVLTTLGLRVGKVTEASSMTVEQGRVISSSPDSGTLLPGQSVNLVISSGKPTVPVPTLTGPAAQSFAGAQAALQAAGLSAAESDRYSNTVAKGQVIATVPPGGTPAQIGSSVTVEISKGPELIPVPNVAGDSVGAATSVLSQAGFVVSGVSGNPTAAVTGTSPSSGALEIKGHSVELITG